MTKQRKTKLPDLETREELAEFWDNHDFTDYLHEMKPMKVKFAKNLSSGITVRFDTTTLNILRSRAAQKGVGATTLIRMWVIERLKQSTHKAA
ncbi:MAG: CopG family antitoxin [Anaerolineae bacterium]